ncbi:unnamed protein product [Didymodactylos carnosus]|uniref:Uncharacterized protein n=1 Tax=Didymodactylos carnosus TaxID=1234261 RepID=A0A8S2JXS3_9BILA|nr:unnamed protein product [Didymodactylos carnosus]CAF3827218.1 unnamed protein product [Didymodactylos carnosus]
MEDLQYKCNDLEQYGRRCAVRIYGIKQKEKNENTRAIVINFAQKIGVNVAEQDIYASHCLGNRKNSTRPITARFLRYETCQSLLHNCSKLRSIQDYKNVYINEDQTRFNYDLFMYAREVLHQHHVRTKNGYPFYHSEDGYFHKLTSFQQIDKLAQQE